MNQPNHTNLFLLFLPLLAALSLLHTSCTNENGSKPLPVVEEHSHGKESTVHLSSRQAEAIHLQLGSVEQKNLTGTLRAAGYLKVPPQNKASISCAHGGTIQSILVQEGDMVSKGQILATLVHDDFIKLQQDYLETQAQLNYSAAEWRRQKELSDKNVSAQKVFQKTESDYHTLTAKHHALKKQLSLLNINAETLLAENISPAATIKSPSNGNVSHISINIGKTVQPTDELMDVVDNAQLHIDLFIYEQDLNKIKIGQQVDIRLTNIPGKQYTAKIFSIGSAFEGESKSVPVHATVTGDKTGLIEGMNVTANIAIETNTFPSVPESAIISFGGNDYIFIRAESNTAGEFSFERIPVKRGITDNGFTEITPLQDIQDDVRLVINGSYYLMSMMTNEGEHEH